MNYTVKSGDSLWAIADSHGMTVDELKSRNPGLTENIQPGQVLVVSGTVASQPTTSGSSSYMVKGGDSLWAIADSHGMTVDELKRLNPGLTENIQPGQVLVVSGG